MRLATMRIAVPRYKKTLALAEATRNRNLGYADLDKDLLRMPFAPSWPSTLSLGATVRVKSLV